MLSGLTDQSIYRGSIRKCKIDVIIFFKHFIPERNSLIYGKYIPQEQEGKRNVISVQGSVVIQQYNE